MASQRLITGLSIAVLLMAGCDTGGGFEPVNDVGQAPDPVVVDFPIAFVERPLIRDGDGNLMADNALAPATFNPGARLILKQRANVAASQQVVTEGVFAPDALYDVKDIQPSVDGSKFLFAMRAPAIEGADIQPTWNVWEYDLELEELRRVIESDINAEAGDDISPYYLPDERIVFSSTRQRRGKAIQLDENKPQFPAQTEARQSDNFLLHIMDKDGDDINQLTYNASHDLQPSVLDNGKILFLRWDNFDDLKNGGSLSLYTVNPDGSEPNFMYGNHSQNTGNNESEGIFYRPRELDNGTILANLRPRAAPRLGGDIIAIDIANFNENMQEVGTTEQSNSQAQQSQTSLQVNIDGSRSPHGYFSSAYPLNDGSGRYLVSWSPCVVDAFGFNTFVNEESQLIDPQGNFVNKEGDVVSDAEIVTVDADEVFPLPCNNETVGSDSVVESDPLYGLWVYDPINNTQAPVDIAESDQMVTEAVILEPLTLQAGFDSVLQDEASAGIRSDGVGVVHIHSVYDLDGVDSTEAGFRNIADPAVTPVNERPARFLRIMKSVPLPSRDVYDFNLGVADGTRNFKMKDLIGYVPIEPDGSAMFKAPADIPLTLAVTDARGRRVSPRHENWFALQAGEVRQCVGCHTDESQVSHGTFERGPIPINEGALSSTAFPNTLLVDNSDAANPVAQPTPQMGETMAAYYARVNSDTNSPFDGARTPNVNLSFVDEWTADEESKGTLIDVTYNGLTTNIPLENTACINNWNPLCRVTINYPDHIEPLWSAPRVIGNTDFACTTCHNSVDVNGMAQLPAGATQLELTSIVSTVRDDYTTSFAELFLRSPVLEQDSETGLIQLEMIHLSVDGVLQYFAIDDMGATVQAGLDTEFELVLDDAGNPVPVIVESGRTFNASMSAGSAIGSNRFFTVFENASATVDHRPLLIEAEKKLLFEWLDMGAAYYNNPFDAPEN